jgi:hypothetical protein
MDREFAKTVLLQEHGRVCDDIRSIEAGGDKIISIALVLLGSGLTFGIEKDIGYIFILVPIAMMGVIYYSVMMYVWVFSLGGYKQHLEVLLNEFAGENLLLWERLVPLRQKLNLASRVLISIYMLVCGGVLAFCVFRIFSTYGHVAGYLAATFLTVGLIVLGVCWRMRDRVHQYTFQKAKELYREAPTGAEIDGE